MIRFARIAVVMAAAAALAPSSAGAYNNHGWFWSNHFASQRVEAHYSDVDSASCIGYGRSYRHKHKTFACAASVDDGSMLSFTLHVLGRRKFAASGIKDVTKPVAPTPTIPPPPVYVPPPTYTPPTVDYPGTGYPVMCADGTLSYSGGIQGACSWHGGVG